MLDSTLSDLLAEYDDADHKISRLNFKVAEERRNRCEIARAIFLTHLASELSEEDRRECEERLYDLASTPNRDPDSTIGAIRLMAKLEVKPELIKSIAEASKGNPELAGAQINNVLNENGYDTRRFDWMSSALTELFAPTPPRL